MAKFAASESLSDSGSAEVAGQNAGFKCCQSFGILPRVEFKRKARRRRKRAEAGAQGSKSVPAVKARTANNKRH